MAEGRAENVGSGGSQGWPFGKSRLERKIGNGWTRILVAIVAIPLLLIAFSMGGWTFSILMLAISIGATAELVRMFGSVEARPYVILLAFAVIALHLLTAAGLNTDLLAERSRGLLFSLLLIFTVLLLFLSLRYPKEVAIRRGPATAFAFLYAGVLPVTVPILYQGINHYLYLIAEPRFDGLPIDPIGDTSFEFILLIFASIWMCDTGAYVVGRSLGRRKLAPTISPNKSVEGAVGGLLFSIGTAVLIGWLFVDALPVLDVVVIGLIVGVTGQLGDLVESHLKRACDVKDSSSIIPGHGGILDRFDSLFLVAPSVLCYLMLRGFWLDISAL